MITSSRFIYQDIVIQITGRTQTPLSIFQDYPPVKERTEIDTDLWIGPISHDIDVVFRACESPGFKFKPTRQFGYRYCFVRERYTDSFPSLEWDEDQRLQGLILLSRIVHPTTISNHYAARLIIQDNELLQIIPGPNHGLGAYAWVPRNDWRDWLSHGDAMAIRNLMPYFRIKELPIRVRRALTHYNFAQLTYSLEQRTASLVTAFESMLKTRRYGLTDQFTVRVLKLASYLKITNLEKSQVESFYDDRSSYLHGASSGWIGREKNATDICEAMEHLLRKALVKTIADSSFLKYFASDSAIDEYFAWTGSRRPT